MHYNVTKGRALSSSSEHAIESPTLLRSSQRVSKIEWRLTKGAYLAQSKHDLRRNKSMTVSHSHHRCNLLTLFKPKWRDKVNCVSLIKVTCYRQTGGKRKGLNGSDTVNSAPRASAATYGRLQNGRFPLSSCFRLQPHYLTGKIAIIRPHSHGAREAHLVLILNAFLRK